MSDIYLDFNATTPVAEEVLEVMLPFLKQSYGNPSSAYTLGREARDAVEEARSAVANLIGSRADEILFTGGGTEASNLAIRRSHPRRNGAIVTTMIEHPATAACCDLLEAQGKVVRRVAPEANGIVPADAMVQAIDDTVALVTMIHAQNETGALQPVETVARRARAMGTIIHADAAQSLGKVPVDVETLGIDLMTIAGHKLYAPKGVGALYVRRGVRVDPLIVGAGQEGGLRPGTENVAFIVGLGAACNLARESLEEFATEAAALTDLLLARLQAGVPGLRLAGDPQRRLPNTLNVLFPKVSGRHVLAGCSRVMASNGSACHAESEEPSAVLLAMGIGREPALGAVRLSVGRQTKRAEVEAAAADLVASWQRLSAGARRAVPG